MILQQKKPHKLIQHYRVQSATPKVKSLVSVPETVEVSFIKNLSKAPLAVRQKVQYDKYRTLELLQAPITKGFYLKNMDRPSSVRIYRLKEI